MTSPAPQPPDDVDHRRRRNRVAWEVQWSRTDFAPPWLSRGVSPEVSAAVADGWFPAGASVLDIGCGQGELVAWLAAQGYPSVGVDISAAAIRRARSLFPEQPGKLEYYPLDICTALPPQRAYGILLDRGCFHQIPAADVPDYLQNLLAVATPTARLLLFVKAFREGIAFGDRTEKQKTLDRVLAAFGGDFELLRHTETYLDPFAGRQAEQALPGMVFWLLRKP